MRKWKILVVDAQDQEALNVTDLRVKFVVKKSREIKNFSTVEIYNLNAETEQKILKEGDRVIIEAGYEGYLNTAADGTVQEQQEKQYGKIFDGKIIYPSRRKENNTDYVLSLLCVDGDNILNANFVAKTLNKGVNQRQILDAVCEKSTTKIPTNNITQGLSGQKLPRGKVIFGEPKDYISSIARGNGASYWVEDGKLNMTKLTDELKDEAIIQTPATGLVGMPTQTQYGANFKLLLNPAVHMWSLVQLKNSEIAEIQATPGQMQAPLDDEWIYQVIELTHTGDTRGNDWHTDCVAVSRYGRGVLPALMANNAQNPNGV
ncbi:MAG: hypothetical protein SPI35_08110 [Porphyromonas sp.]|nr:hypothetical protein [Porphyromonas sp.]